jgi:hypothetical protein
MALIPFIPFNPVQPYANCRKNCNGTGVSFRSETFRNVLSIELTFFVIQIIRFPFVEVILSESDFIVKDKCRTNAKTLKT